MKLSDSIEFLNNQTKVHDSKLAELRELIAVTEPYYALSDLYLHDNVLSAAVPLELTDHMEPFGMAIPEIGRHMAILGSLALANANPKKEKHYYLATHAIVERKHDKPGGDGMYFGKVKVQSINKRLGEITGELYNPFGELFCTIEVKYSILHEMVFNRMFSNVRQTSSIKTTKNPYTSTSQLYNINLGDKISNASLGIIKKESCAGHFKDFAALPIARLGGALTSLSGLHHNFICGSNKKYCIRKAEIHAKSFVFAGKKLNLFTQLINSSNNKEICIESFANTTECNRVVDYKLWFF